MKKNPLIKKYGGEKRWVNYKMAEREGRTTKLPYTIKGKLASTVNEADWSTYEDAAKNSDQVGIVFTPKQTLLGIDIDHCLKGKKIVHEKAEEIAALIIEADTYTEISPSGEGLHLYLSLKAGLALTSNRKSPFEVYTSGRYFTFTGNIYKEEKPVRSISLREASELLAIIGYPWKEESAERVEAKPVQKEGGSQILEDSILLQKLFKNKKAKALYEGDTSEYENDGSRADMALLAHLAFWTRKDAMQMDRIWLASPLGARDKTQKRTDYRERSISAAIAACKAIYETKAIRLESEFPELKLLSRVVGKGEIEYLQNTENICRILAQHPEFRGRFRYDSFKNIMEIKRGEKWEAYREGDDVLTQTKISVIFSDWFGTVSKQMVYDAMVKVSFDNMFDSAAEYIRSIEWDGEERLDTWLSKTYGAPKDDYHKAVASNWIKGMVKRIIEPGCKFDYVLVLEGAQGSKKSTSLAVLGGDWHVETTMSTDNKDFFMQFQGKAIVEFSEGETMSRTEVKKMKAIITTQIDRYRSPYGKVSQDFPRHCVFAMTTNQEEYLKDETGNRRWLPVHVMFDQADIEWLAGNRDQIFAEAYHRVIELKETIYEFPAEETLRQQQMRRVSDPNQDVITEWYFSIDYERQKRGISIHNVFKEALRGGVNRSMNKYEEMSIAVVLKEHLKLVRKHRMVSGVRMPLWCNATGKPMEGDEVTEAQKEDEDNY